MSQHDMNIANQGFPAFREDLNNALPALASNNAGATEPSTMIAHQWWVDTSATPNLLKQRNTDNDAWITVGSFDQVADTFNLAVAQGGTGSTTASGARTAFGVVIGTDVQANLVSGTNIKTVNSTSLLGSGNIVVGGKVVQVVNFQTGAVATGTTVMPGDNTIPQITEGNEYMTLAITPTSAVNVLRIDVVYQAASNATNYMTAAIFVGTTANALAAITSYKGTAADSREARAFSHRVVAGVTTELTFRVRLGNASAGTTTFNGASGIRLLGGIAASSITITEYTPA